MKQNRHCHSREGVSLIIVLGLLSVLIVLAIAFSRSMREGRLTSRSYAHQVRAESLIQVALVRAMEDVDSTLAGCCYPCWTPADAMCSSNPAGTFPCALLTGEATNFIPCALWADTIVAASSCCWSNIVSDGGSRTNGRIAYLVVNCSGMLDANVVGQEGTPVAGLDLSLLPDIPVIHLDLFYSARTNHIRYETIEELAKLNGHVSDPVSNFFIFSYDPNRDEYYTTNQLSELGTRTIDLTNKCLINDPVGNWDRITNLMAEAGVSDYRAAGWNLVNYIDPDCIPTNDSPQPWLDSGGTEPVPLINEICLTLTNAATTSYCFQVELFYPFLTRQPVSTEGMLLQMVVSPANATCFTNEDPITHMEFATQPFLVYTSPEFTIRDGTGTNVVPVSPTNTVCFLARIILTNGSTSTADQAIPDAFTATGSRSVNDPRCNAASSWWEQTNSTLGAMNVNCDPWSPTGQGLPIFFANGPMQSIGEIGHIFTGVPWETIDLLSTNGGWLIDTMTTRTNAGSTRGLVNINTRQKDVLMTLFAGATIGVTNSDCSTNRILDEDTELVPLVNSFPDPSNTVMNCFADYLYFMGESEWVPIDIHANKELKEDVFRSTLDLITFRQNLFTIIVAAQVLGADGRPVAEKRAVAIVYRDSYTGKHFTRFQKWLSK